MHIVEGLKRKYKAVAAAQGRWVENLYFGFWQLEGKLF